MTNCPNCGKPNEDLQSHCIDCGQSLTAEPVVNEPAPTTPEEQPQVTTEMGAEAFGQTQPFTPPVVPQPKKKSRLGLYLGGGILGIVAVVGIVFLVLTMMNPLRTIAAAASKTGEALQQQIGTFQSLEAFTEAYKNYTTADRTAEAFTIALGNADAGTILLKVDGLTDYAAHTGYGELSLGAEGGESIVVPIYIDDSGVSITASQIFEDTLFYMDMDYLNELFAGDLDLPEDIFAREVTETMSDEQLQSVQAVKDAFAQLLVGTDAQKQELYTHGDAQWTPYLLTFQDESVNNLKTSLVDLFTTLSDSSTELNDTLELSLSGLDMSIEDVVDELMWLLNASTVYINDQGYLVGYSFMDEEDTLCMVALEGEENPWTHYAFYDGDTTVLQGELTNTDGILTLTAGDGDYESLVRLTYEDATGTFTLTVDEADSAVSLRMYAENEQAVCRISAGNADLEIGLDMTFGSSTETIEKLSGDIIYDLSTITKEETDALTTEATMALLLDPELSGIVEDILTVLQEMGILTL